jgi:hypothetical protein
MDRVRGGGPEAGCTHYAVGVVGREMESMAERIAAGTGVARACHRAYAILRHLVAPRFGRSQATVKNALRLEEKLSLGPKKMLYLVSCREKEFLIAAGADAIVSMIEVSPAASMQAAGSRKASLARIEKREPLS